MPPPIRTLSFPLSISLIHRVTVIAAGGVVVAETLVLSYDDEEENDRCWWFRTVNGRANACLRLFQLVYCRIAGRVKR